MTTHWMKLGMKLAVAVSLLGTLVLSACDTPPGSNRAAAQDLRDPASDNTQSVPFDAWFKDRPQ
jgi:hypothetical protein